MTVELQFLNAREGDAIWIRWGHGHQILVDLGTSASGTAFADRVRALPEDQRAFDLLVVTHVDTDHIGGVLTGIVEQQADISGWRFHDVWFNGWEHLHGNVPGQARSPLEPLGGAQGEQFTTWLRTQSWNRAFGGAAVVRVGAALPRVDLADGVALTVLAPVQARLTDLIDKWQEDVEAALAAGNLDEVSPGLERLGPTVAPVLETAADLQALADTSPGKDSSRANAASITLLLEWEGRSVLLTGDATSSELVAGLEQLDAGDRVPFDVIKLPHHGSRHNVSTAFVEAVDCATWVVSSDGTKYHHPDPAAIARVLQHGAPSPTLVFNTPSKFNGWWANPGWRAAFEYDVTYGDPVDGFTLTLDPA